MKKDRPKLPAWGYDYAMEQAQRLKQTYPKKLRGGDVGREFGIQKDSATKYMNSRGFWAFDNRYRWEDVAAVLTERQYWRRKKLDEILGRSK